MTKRKTLSKKLRFEIFKRDSFICQYCGNHPPSVILEVDHIVPVVDGGDNSQDNLITSCFDCNRGKGKNSLDSTPKPLKERQAELEEQEDQIQGYADVMLARRQRIEDHAWLVADIFVEHFSTDKIRKDYLKSIKIFNDRLGVAEVMNCMEVAVCSVARSQNQVFKYFCGVCWNVIRSNENG